MRVGGHGRDSEPPLTSKQAGAVLRRKVENARAGVSPFDAEGAARLDPPPGHRALDAGFCIPPTAGTDCRCGEALPGAVEQARARYRGRLE